MEAHENQPALPLRSHTILGVCEAIGEDFGFSPMFVRIPLAGLVLWSIEYALIVYLTLGAIVLASRLLFPQPKSSVATQASVEALAAANESGETDLPLAA